ncbi:MAG: helix-turn-helix domain-containing protein [Actinobacteria bacterium]|nr:helix-turn-helix domain-containing protein [Actinomycetota bacterium]
MSTEFLTLEEAAERLGVHYMTAYRYVRQGKLSATRVKGVWQVTPQAIDEFRQRANERKERPRTGDDSRRTGDYVNELHTCLVNADAGGAWGVLQRAIDAGGEIGDVYLAILAPAMARIGEEWSRGEIDIAIEHQATAIATRLVGQMSPRFVRRGRRRGEVLIGGPSGERHALALAMLGDLLRLEGYDVFDLGADTPANSFVHAASKINNLTAVGVSVTTTESVEGAIDVVRTLRRAIGDEVPVVLGGSAISGPEHAREIGADFYANGARGFVELLDSITRGSSTVDDEMARETDSKSKAAKTTRKKTPSEAGGSGAQSRRQSDADASNN